MNKRIAFKLLAAAVLMTLSVGSLSAQQLETSIYAGGLLPTGQFARYNAAAGPMASGIFAPLADTSIAKGASPAVGLTARMGFFFDIGFGEIMPFLEAGFVWNAPKRAVRDAFDQAYSHGEAAKAPQYFNVPILAGFKYRYAITDIVMPFVEFGLGTDIFFISGNGFRENGPWYTYKPSADIAWQVGLGTYLSGHFSAGAYYTSYGSHKISYTSKSSGRNDGSTPNYTERRTLGEIGLRLGFHF